MTQLRLYTRDGVSMSAYDVVDVAPYVTMEVARRRLLRWENGTNTECDSLYALPNGAKSGRNGKSLLHLACQDLQPRRKIEDLPPLSAFERRWLRRLEKEDAVKMKPWQDPRGSKKKNRAG